MKLKNEFKFRLIMDDSTSFGTLGRRGMGILDHFDMLPSSSNEGKSNDGEEGEVLGGVEIMVVSMENSVGSIGGISLGSSEVVDHQRLSGSGYCFSASTPPFLCTCSVASLDIIERDGVKMLNTLSANILMVVDGLKRIPSLKVVSDDKSALIFFTLQDGIAISQDDESYKMSQIALDCDDAGLSIVYTGDHVKGPLLLVQPDPMLRISVSISHDQKTIKEALKIIDKVCKALLKVK
jgi:serine palmitoyltransferase